MWNSAAREREGMWRAVSLIVSTMVGKEGGKGAGVFRGRGVTHNS